MSPTGEEGTPEPGRRGASAARGQGRAREHLRAVDPVLRELIDARPGFDPRAWLAELPPMDAFGVLLFQIAGQQLSLAATRAIVRRLQEIFDGRLPSAEQAAAADPRTLARAGLSRRKVSTVRELARRFAAGELEDAWLASASDEQIERALTATAGVGPWTVHGFLIIALDRPDVMLPGDLALRRAVRDAYALEHMPDQAEMLALAEPWRPYRSLAVAYLFDAELGAQAGATARPR